jgi:hypothetical protein
MVAGRPELLPGLPPIIDAGVRTLILGSFPSPASLAAAHYYAHPQNQFWRLLEALLDEPLSALDYAGKQRCLLQHRIGLWDVYRECRRPRCSRCRHRVGGRQRLRASARRGAAIALHLLQWPDRGSFRGLVPAAGLCDAGAAVDQPGVHAGFRTQAGRMAGGDCRQRDCRLSDRARRLRAAAGRVIWRLAPVRRAGTGDARDQSCAALFACLLVALAARRVCRLAAIDGRHLLLHAALESKVLVDGGRHSVRRAACVCGRGEVA